MIDETHRRVCPRPGLAGKHLDEGFEGAQKPREIAIGQPVFE